MLRILIYDSGVGGLSISQSLTNLLPFAEQILLSDNACFPYGEMKEQELISRVTDLLSKAVPQLQPDCIVVACNTVSTLALEKIRSALSIPVIGVVPAIKPAAAMSRSKVIGLLATPATVERSYTADLVNNYADDCTLISIGNTRLVEIAEQKVRGTTVDLAEIRSILAAFYQAEEQQNLDTVVLGCTHFPLLSEQLSQLLPETITLIDSSTAIARQVDKILEIESPLKHEQAKLTNDHVSAINYRCLITKSATDNSLAKGLEKFKFATPELFS